MTWLHVPSSTTLTSARAPECSDWPSTPLSDLPGAYEPFVTLNGKPSRRPLSWPAWKTRPWIKRLFLTIFASSSEIETRLTTFADSVLSSSLRAIPASPSAQPVDVVARTILDIYGPQSLTSLRQRFPSSASSRMSQGTLDLGMDECEEICESEATALRKDSSARRKSARAIRGNGCSSWPTTSAFADSTEKCGKPDKGRRGPNSGRTLTGKALEVYGQGPHAKKKAWTTPQAHDVHPGDPERVGRYGTKHGGRNLNDDAAKWPTPHGFQAGNGPDGNEFAKKVKNWGTPRVSTNAGIGNENREPKARLEDQAAHFSPPAPKTSTPGDDSSKSTRALNPRFVEILMGWPPGWTTARTGFALQAMEFSRWRQATLSSLSSLVSSESDAHPDDSMDS